ncbi:hypothetical protein F4780DRAFT_474335 [Xylariomycetidae sp. FL0641]|nr:hypothetical protein F4780DRAFT_474335 [Xylariomycetidae sp. FL0641]
MDHLSSRFRRSKRASPAPTPATQEPSPALSSDDTNPTPAVPATGDRASKATRTTSPPVLSITTTPPRSKDNGSNGIANTLQSLHPPKSPFRGFHHFRSAHKRARSPAPASLPVPTSPAIVNQDGTVEHSMTPTTGAHSPNGDSTPIEKHKIPYFLTLSPSGMSSIYNVFHSYSWLSASSNGSSTNPRFSR